MRAYQDLREFLTVLEQERQLLRITDEVQFEPDLAAAACALARIGETGPAILFNKIAGCTDAQVAMNVHGSWPNHALALGMDKDAPLRDQFFEFVRRFEQFPGQLERVADCSLAGSGRRYGYRSFRASCRCFASTAATAVFTSTKRASSHATPTTGTTTTSRTSVAIG